MGYKTSIFSFVSGKFYLLKHLLPFPEHKIYVEPFAGSGVVLLNKKSCRVEVYNDINKEFVNFWLVLRDYHFFLRLFCEELLDSRETFNDFKNGNIDDKYILSIFSSFLDSIFARAVEQATSDAEIIDITKKYKELRDNDNLKMAFEFLYNQEFSHFHLGTTYQGISFKRTDSPENLKVFSIKYQNKTESIASLKDAFSFFYKAHHSFHHRQETYNGIGFGRKAVPNHLSDQRVTFLNKNDEMLSFKDAFSFFYKIGHSFSYKGDAFNGISLTHEDARNKVREAFVEKLKDDKLFNDQFNSFRDTFVQNPLVNKSFEKFSMEGNPSDDFSRISWIWNRIKNVHFECQDFRKLIPRVDREGVLIYLDPPYFKSPELCSNSFTIKDHEDLRLLLKNITQAKWILSIDNRDFYNDPKWFYQQVTRKNRAGNKDQDKEKDEIEYIISNFDRTKQVNKQSTIYAKLI